MFFCCEGNFFFFIRFVSGLVLVEDEKEEEFFSVYEWLDDVKGVKVV